MEKGNPDCTVHQLVEARNCLSSSDSICVFSVFFDIVKVLPATFLVIPGRTALSVLLFVSLPVCYSSACLSGYLYNMYKPTMW